MKLTEYIRPRFTVPDTIELRDTIQQIVVANLFDEKLTTKQIDNLVSVEKKLSLLIEYNKARGVVRGIPPVAG